jgi:DNA-binding transcriptional ArsR family regulator
VDDDAVFRALADPGRRALLDALAARDGQRLGELCAVLPDLTRFGVMKHLGVLEAAGLVVSRRAGRSKLHYLNPIPIQQVADRWIAKYLRRRASELVALADRLEA